MGLSGQDTAHVAADGRQISTAEFRERVVRWGVHHIRAFPWRGIDNPFLLLIAETLLHRTQVGQVIPVFERMKTLYPDAGSLAQAPREQIDQILHPLGLHWRSELISDMARALIRRFDGRVPEGRAELESLPGVGDYIASAVRCFAFGYSDALIDTNTVRITARVFGWKAKPSSRRNPQFRSLIANLVDPQRPQTYNYAMLDLAHLVCYARREPDCPRCPLAQLCSYNRTRPST